jgi:hypothetical protein
MLKTFFLLVILTLCRFPQDVRVITYSNGRTNPKDYESLAFWIKSNQRAYVRYAHGTDDEIDIGWGGPDSSGGKKGFRLRGPADTLNWVLIPQGNAIRITDRRGRQKELRWENEGGPSPDSGCTICAKNESQAMAWLQKYFFR